MSSIMKLVYFKGAPMPFTAETNIQDVINDPSFEGCGQFLFPPLKTVDNLKLKELYRLLHHHSNVSIEADRKSVV